MKLSSFYNQPPVKQVTISVAAVLTVSTICFLLSNFLSYQVVALILMVTVSVSAMFFEIKAVLSAAILSALVWNFFFIPPRFTLAISKPEDVLLFLMYFVIAMVNAVFTTRIRRAEKESAKKKEEENAIRLYNTLLNSLSHELKTPISTIIAACDNLQTLSDKLSEHNKYELVEEITKAGSRLNRQVENLLNMSRLESGYIKPKADWIDLSELINEVIEDLKTLANGKPVHVVLPKNLPLIESDYGLFYHVLHNLLHNALTYIPKYAVVTIKVVMRGKHLVIMIEDTGNGFPENEINRVFDKFYRLQGSAAGGTGLGLSIVKGFVEALGGIITLENIDQAGARFTIELAANTRFLTLEKT